MFFQFKVYLLIMEENLLNMEVKDAVDFKHYLKICVGGNMSLAHYRGSARGMHMEKKTGGLKYL